MRLALFFVSMQVVVSARQIKLDAWLCRKFVALIKRKLHRGQVPRSHGFRQLMAAVDRDAEDMEEDCVN